MTDLIDRANDQAEEILQRTIASARCAVPALPYTGKCYNCGARMPQSKRFCDRDCCADYESRQRLTSRR